MGGGDSSHFIRRESNANKEPRAELVNRSSYEIRVAEGKPWEPKKREKRRELVKSTLNKGGKSPGPLFWGIGFFAGGVQKTGVEVRGEKTSVVMGKKKRREGVNDEVAHRGRGGWKAVEVF